MEILRKPDVSGLQKKKKKKMFKLQAGGGELIRLSMSP